MILGLSSCDNKETTNSVYIQGGGTLDDWANLSKYKESNKILMSEIDENRVYLENKINKNKEIMTLILGGPTRYYKYSKENIQKIYS